MNASHWDDPRAFRLPWRLRDGTPVVIRAVRADLRDEFLVRLFDQAFALKTAGSKTITATECLTFAQGSYVLIGGQNAALVMRRCA